MQVECFICLELVKARARLEALVKECLVGKRCFSRVRHQRHWVRDADKMCSHLSS